MSIMVDSAVESQGCGRWFIDTAWQVETKITTRALLGTEDLPPLCRQAGPCFRIAEKDKWQGCEVNLIVSDRMKVVAAVIRGLGGLLLPSPQAGPFFRIEQKGHQQDLRLNLIGVDGMKFASQAPPEVGEFPPPDQKDCLSFEIDKQKRWRGCECNIFDVDWMNVAVRVPHGPGELLSLSLQVGLSLRIAYPRQSKVH